MKRFFRRRYWDQERARELDAHIAIQTAENITRGMTPEEAAFAARKKLGNQTLIREEIYSMNSLAFFETVWQDLRHGARLLRLNPGFTTVALLSLALGIGANTAIFQLLDAVRLRTLPVGHPEELAEVRLVDMKGARGGFPRYPSVSNPIWEQIRDRQKAFSGIFAWTQEAFNISPTGESRLARGLWVSGSFFEVLGVQPFAGRLFTPADDRRGCGLPGAVVSYAFWQGEFGGEASAIGRKIPVDSNQVEIIGVTPPSFFGLEVGRSFDVALPICSEGALRGKNSSLDSGTTWWLTVMGRFNASWPLDRLTAHLGSISPAVFESSLPSRYPPASVKDYLASRLAAYPAGNGLSRLRDQYSDPLLLLLGTAALVLLIACANLANLMLARASARDREIAVRLAIGASRGRLIRQFMAESLLIAFIGAAMGLFLAGALNGFLVSLLSTRGTAIFVDLQTDWSVLLFTVGLALLTCLLFGLMPALRATTTAPGTALKAGSRGMTVSRERFGLRRVLVAAQVALSLVLLAGALLFVRSLRNLMTVDAGFQQDGIVIANLDFSRLNIPPDRMSPFKRDLVERLRAIPGVDSAAETDVVPLSGNRSGNRLSMDGPDSAKGKGSFRSRIGTGYFKTLATPLLSGRDFDDHDTATSPKVAIVNEAFASQFTNGSNPVGRRFWVEATPYQPETAYDIVGLVRNTKYISLREDFPPVAFFPLPQDSRPSLGGQILIRSGAPLEALTASLKGKLNEVSPEIRFAFTVFKTQIRDGLLRERLMATLSGFFGALAVLLATIGLYGVMSYSVARRRNEIGIRMALGAGRRDILAMVLREAAVLLAIGIVAGTLLAVVAARAAAAMLYGLQPHDPVTMAMAIAALGAVALTASYLPARRAASVDPMQALREE